MDERKYNDSLSGVKHRKEDYLGLKKKNQTNTPIRISNIIATIIAIIMIVVLLFLLAIFGSGGGGPGGIYIPGDGGLLAYG